MMNLFLRLFGERVAHKVIAKRSSGGPLDMKFGWALLRDRRLPVRFKLMALGLGAGLLAVLLALEMPVELITGLLGGLPIDLAFDGMEILILPILLACLLLPRVSPSELVEQLRTERADRSGGRIIDVTAG